MWAGWMRRCARRVATRRISWTDQRIRSGASAQTISLGFLGARILAWWRIVASMAKANMTSETWRCQPCQERLSLWSRPSSFLAVSKPSSIVQRCPSTATRVSMSGPGRAPGGEVGALAVGRAAPDQQATGPQAGARRPGTRPRQGRPIQIGPIVEPRTLGALARRQALPGGGLETLRDRLGGPGDLRLADPGIEGLRGVDAEHVAFARPAQRHLDLAHPVDGVSRYPGERHPGRNGTLDHAPASRGLVAKPISAGT